MIVLDDTEARAEYDVLWQQYLVLRATEERLRAELAQQPALTIPDDLKWLANDSVFSGVWRGQVNQFESRLAALAGQRNVINEKIAQLEAQLPDRTARDVIQPGIPAEMTRKCPMLLPLHDTMGLLYSRTADARRSRRFLSAPRLRFRGSSLLATSTVEPDQRDRARQETVSWLTLSYGVA